MGFNFPSKRTFVYDVTTSEWATRESVNQGVSVPYRVCSIVEAYGVLLVGDCLSTKIGILDKDTLTEYGTDIRRKFVTPQMDNEGDPFWIDALEIWGDAGIGLTDGTSPDVQMSFSRDGGRTFSNSISRTMGNIGEYENRTIWNSWGRFGRQICFQFEVSAAVKWVFTKVEASLE